jgi:putative tricarboxylic transport membrane protein
LSISQGDPGVFITHPISASLLGVALLMIFSPVIIKFLSKRRTGSSEAG